MQWKILGRTVYVPKTAVLFLASVVCVVTVIGGYFLLQDTENTVMEVSATARQSEPTGTVPSLSPSPSASVSPVKGLWHIYIVGAVKNPGVYTLEEGALVQDAVIAAGGLLPEAEADTVNLVQVLQDNVMIRILTAEERVEQGRAGSLVLIKDNQEIYGGQTVSATDDAGAAEKININSASKEELMTLSGIGEARAESIIAYREEKGPFQTIEDIMLVSGIKENAFAKIKDRITT